MRYFLQVAVILFSVSIVAEGQTLSMYPKFGSTRFEYKKDTTTITVSPKQVSQILQDDPLAASEFKKARTNYALSGVLGFSGGVLIAIPVASAIGGGDPDWALAAGGAALILASIPFHKSFLHHAESAIDRYNNKHTSSFRPKAHYYFAGTGAGVIIKF